MTRFMSMLFVFTLLLTISMYTGCTTTPEDDDDASDDDGGDDDGGDDDGGDDDGGDDDGGDDDDASDDDSGDDDGGDDDGGDDDGGDDDTYVPSCNPPGSSSCGNQASIIRGTVRIDGSIVPNGTTGDLIVGVSHTNLGSGPTGGAYHAFMKIPNVDVSVQPYPEFSLDFCLGGEMWTEENCPFNLIAVLDLNSSYVDYTVPVPDQGEPAAMITPLDISCNGQSPCIDVVLDCVAGQSCVSFTSNNCACETQNPCYSPIVTCIP